MPRHGRTPRPRFDGPVAAAAAAPQMATNKKQIKSKHQRQPPVQHLAAFAVASSARSATPALRERLLAALTLRVSRWHAEGHAEGSWSLISQITLLAEANLSGAVLLDADVIFRGRYDP